MKDFLRQKHGAKSSCHVSIRLHPYAVPWAALYACMISSCNQFKIHRDNNCFINYKIIYQSFFVSLEELLFIHRTGNSYLKLQFLLYSILWIPSIFRHPTGIPFQHIRVLWIHFVFTIHARTLFSFKLQD